MGSGDGASTPVPRACVQHWLMPGDLSAFKPCSIPRQSPERQGQRDGSQHNPGHQLRVAGHAEEGCGVRGPQPCGPHCGRRLQARQQLADAPDQPLPSRQLRPGTCSASSLAAHAIVLLHTLAWPCKSPPLNSSDTWPMKVRRGSHLSKQGSRAGAAQGQRTPQGRVPTVPAGRRGMPVAQPSPTPQAPPNAGKPDLRHISCQHSPQLATAGRQTAAASGGARMWRAASV